MNSFHSANLRLELLAADRAVLWIDMAEKSVNVFGSQVLTDFEAALAHLEKESTCKILLLRSAKPGGFVAGADIHEFTQIRQPEEAAALSARGQQLFDRLAQLRQTTIAVIHGPCLGGGLECALACDYRLAVDQPKTQLGLPEIDLGLIPAWGGTQRLPSVVGLEAALTIILGRKRLNARESLSWGLVDAMAPEDGVETALEELVARALRQGKRSKHRLPLRTWRQKLIESNPLGRYVLFRGSQRLLRERVPDDMPAPVEALEAVRAGINQGAPCGLASERAAISRLATTPACRNLVRLFFIREQARKLPVELRADLVRPIRRVGVVGAGTMGAGIAQLAAINGSAVIVQEVNEAALAAGMHKIEDLFRKAVANRVLSANEAAQKQAAICRTTTWQGFDNVDLVVEAVIEDLHAKRAVFRELEQHTKPTTLLATNTSSLLVAGLQEGREHPERIGGLHFFNPVHKMPLVEVVRAPLTDDATIASLAQWAIDLGKMPVVVKDSPGFVVNRILMPYLNEAVVLLGRLRSDLIDKIMRQFGMPLGPLELLDQVGLDVAAHIEKSMRPHLANRYAPNDVFAEMSNRGWFGEKSKVGFYQYAGKKKTVNSQVHLSEVNGTLRLATSWRDDRRFTNMMSGHTEEFRNRLVLLMVNEAAACLGEGIAASAETIDQAMVFGTGWAPHRGGPLQYADDRGIAEIVRELQELAQTHGPRFEPCAELQRRAAGGEMFYLIAS